MTGGCRPFPSGVPLTSFLCRWRLGLLAITTPESRQVMATDVGGTRSLQRVDWECEPEPDGSDDFWFASLTLI